MKSLFSRTSLYHLAIAYIFLSPLINFNDFTPSLIQKWPMYVGSRPICTMRFEDPRGENPGFHAEIFRELNTGLGRPPETPFVLPTERAALRILKTYCENPETRERPFHANLVCFQRGRWVDVPDFGKTQCPI